MHDALSHNCALTRALTQHTIMRCFSTRTFARVSLGALMYIQIHAHYILLPWLAHALFCLFILIHSSICQSNYSFVYSFNQAFIHSSLPFPSSRPWLTPPIHHPLVLLFLTCAHHHQYNNNSSTNDYDSLPLLCIFLDAPLQYLIHKRARGTSFFFFFFFFFFFLFFIR